MQRSIWVLAANSSKAFIYQAKTPAAPLEELHSFDHEPSRMHVRDLTSDLPGRAYDSSGEGRHIMEQPVDPKREEAIRFAKQLADFLNKSLQTQQFSTLFVAAAPAFLGLLRDHFPTPLQKSIQQEMNKDLTDTSPADIRAKFPQFL